jgi:hypothetical protein
MKSRLASASRLCVVICDPGPVAAALYVRRPGAPECKARWLGGRRPRWVARAPRDWPCLIVDAAAPTLADALDDASPASLTRARERMARIGIDEALDYAVLEREGFPQAAYAAIRSSGVVEACALAQAQGLVADAVTSMLAVELGAFMGSVGMGDHARLTLFPHGAFLVSRSAGRLSARRFALPAARAELETALARLCAAAAPGAHLTLDGLRGPDLPELPGLLVPAGVELEDSRRENVGDAYSGMMDRVADLWAEGGALASFAPRHQRAHNLAVRWLPPLALALGMLAAALLPALREAWSRAEEARRDAELSAGRLAALRLNVDANDGESGRNDRALSALEYRRRCVDGALTSRGTLLRFLDARQAAARFAAVRFERVAVDDAGRKISLSGTFPETSRASFDQTLDYFSELGFGPASDIAFSGQGGLVRFNLNMEEKP